MPTLDLSNPATALDLALRAYAAELSARTPADQAIHFLGAVTIAGGVPVISYRIANLRGLSDTTVRGATPDEVVTEFDRRNAWSSTQGVVDPRL